ncbi:MAG: PEP-CTERM sorting domain-containing protein [Candidatus Acidiferrum sp.]
MFTIALAAPDASGDTYNWNAIPNNTRGEAVFNISDITTGLEGQGVVLSSLASGTEDSGDLTISAVATPEPSSVALLLVGIGFVLAMRKRSSGLQQAS